MNKITINNTDYQVTNPTRFDDFWKHVGSGQWESSTINAITKNLKSGDVYIDIGAWIGPTVLAAASTGCIVHAYEPDPVAFAELSANISANKTDGITLNNAALFDRHGEMSFGSGRGDSLGDSISSLMNGYGSIQVPVRDIAQEQMQDFFKSCKLLKIDVEGAEYVIMPRMASYLSEYKPSLLLSIHGIRTAGYPGFTGFLKMIAHRLMILNIISMYKYQFIENRRGWLDSNASWVKFGLRKKINFVLSARGNRELMLSNSQMLY
jgi:FkbM family methyltransferase